MNTQENNTAVSTPESAVAPTTDNMRAALGAYKDWRMAKILLIGLISGFPWILIASMMSLWLKAEGLSRTGIGLFGLVFTVYAFNMFWAPVVDKVRIPVLGGLGQRRSWIVLMQIFIGVLMVMVSQTSPQENLVLISILCFLIALFSATQDVAVDALRIELIGRAEANKVGAGSAMATSGWWLGYGAMGSVGLFLAEYYETSMGIENFWQFTYLSMTVVIILSVVLLLLFVKEPVGDDRSKEQQQDYEQFVSTLSQGAAKPLEVMLRKSSIFAVIVGGLLFSLFAFNYLKGDVGGEDTSAWLKFIVIWGGWIVLLWVVFLAALFIVSLFSKDSTGEQLKTSMVSRAYAIWYLPVASFIKNYGVRVGLYIIALVFLFKVGEAFLGRMSIIFYKEIGFSKSDIALYSKGYGTIALISFTILGSIINARYGLFRGLLIGGIAMASTNLLFAALALQAEPSKWLFGFAVVTDQFTTAMSTVALVAFLSQLCDRAYAATQYAALASLGNFSRTTLAIGSGALVDGLGGNWSLFFVITTLMVLPSLALLLYIRKDIATLMAGKTTKLL